MQSKSPTESLEQAANEWPYPVPERPAHQLDDASNQAMRATARANANEDERQRRIADMAHQIAMENGFPEGRDLEHWLEAERRLGSS